MSEQIQNISYSSSAITVNERNKVLKNTYKLLSLTLIPSVLGAWLGVATGLGQALSGGIGIVLFLVGAFGFIYAIEKNKNTAKGIPILLGFTFFMGLMMSRLLGHILGLSNGTNLIITAFGGTALIFFVMSTLASVIKRDISGMGQWLFVGVIALMIGSIINIFLGSGIAMLVISTLSLIIFSAYMLYDVKNIVDGGEENYISATLTLYLNLINIFQSLLSLLGIVGGEKD
jgi:modulator of FtsH protease